MFDICTTGVIVHSLFSKLYLKNRKFMECGFIFYSRCNQKCNLSMIYFDLTNLSMPMYHIVEVHSEVDK